MTINEFFSPTNSILHFTHNADADGAGCAALSITLLADHDIKIVEVGNRNFVSAAKHEIEKNLDISVLITDMALDANLVEYLEEKSIPYVWIDHHNYALTESLDKIMKTKLDQFIIYNKTYTDDDLGNVFQVSHAFDSSSRYDGRVKLSAFAIYYMVLKQIGYTLEKRYSLQPDDVTEIEHWVIESLSNADTFDFQNLNTSDRWFRTTFDTREECKKASEKYTIYMNNIVDPWQLIYKNEGSKKMISDIEKAFRNISSWKKVVGPRIQVYQKNRIAKYISWKKSIIPMCLNIGNDHRAMAAFTSQYDADISQFSLWLWTDCEEYNMLVSVEFSSRRIGFRSPESGPVVDTIARNYFGGGGHPHASGGHMTIGDAINLLTAMWDTFDAKNNDRNMENYYGIEANIRNNSSMDFRMVVL